MNIFVDVDLHQLIQSPGARSPASPWEIKSQDTLATNLFFCSGGLVLDLGESPVLKFGLVAKTDIATFLVFESTFVRLVDPINGVCYQALCVFNTTEMVAALATLSPLPCILEIRFALADGEIVHTLDQNVTVDRTILVEGGTPAATVIAVYPDPSVLEVKSNKDQPSGYAALSSAGFLKPTDFDPTVVVLQSSRDVALGFPGLDASTLIPVAEIPIDGVTIISAAGKLSSIGPALQIVSVTTQAFTTPMLGGTVEIEAPVAQLVVGAYYLMSGVGLYQYTAAIDATHGTYTQIPAPASAIPGISIPSGQLMQTSGPPGPQGVTGATGIAGLTWRGAWSGSTAYAVNDGVSLAGVSYICILAHTNQTPPNATYWGVLAAAGAMGAAGTSFNWRGGWLIGTAYLPNDVVSDNNGSWINILANTGSQPSTDGGTHWTLLAAQGATGATGGIGPTGHGLNIKGTVATSSALPGGATTGDTYIALDTNHAWIWDGTTWDDVGGITGPTGASGAPGTAGGTGPPGSTGPSGVLSLVDAETSAGLTLLGSTAGQVKRLIAGTNVTLDATTTAGGVIVNASGGGGGSAVFAQIIGTTGSPAYSDSTPFPFTSAVTDASGFWSSGAPSKLTVPTGLGGLYLATWNFCIKFTTAGTGIGVCIAKNSWNGNGPAILVPGLVGINSYTLTGLMQLAAGDYINCVGYTAWAPDGSGSAPTSWEQVSASAGSNSNGIGPVPMLTLVKVA